VTAYSTLDPVSAAVYGALNVAALTALAPGGVGDVIEQNTGFPYVLYEVSEANLGGMGSKPGVGRRTLEVSVRVHVFSSYVGFIEAQQIMATVIQLLADPPAVTGYGRAAIFHDDTVPLSAQIIAGVPVNELVGLFRLYLTET